MKKKPDAMHGANTKHAARVQHEKGHSVEERVWYTATLEPSDTPPGSHLSHMFAPKAIASTAPYDILRFQSFLSAQPTPLEESLGQIKKHNPWKENV